MTTCTHQPIHEDTVTWVEPTLDESAMRTTTVSRCVGCGRYYLIRKDETPACKTPSTWYSTDGASSA